MMKTCKMCNSQFEGNPYIWCDECIEIDNAILNRLKKGNLSPKDEKRLRKALKLLRQEIK